MDFEFSEEEKQFRVEVEDFIKRELPDDWDERIFYWPGGYGTNPLTEEQYQHIIGPILRDLGDKGWFALPWPEEYGGQNSVIKQAILDDVMSYYRLPSATVATSIAGPTIIHIGSEAMKKEWLPKIRRGEISFYLGYSEPDAGSDLASIRTTAVRDGNDFIINGQKIWSSGAHVSDYCWLLAKTDPDGPKHKDASLIIVDNRSPGITINPLINICGLHCFNEVFFDNVTVPAKNIVGGLNDGFYNVMLALQYERLVIGKGSFKRVLEDLINYVKKREQGGKRLSENPNIRGKLASMAIEIEAMNGLYWYTAWLMDKGQVPELEASALKLFAMELGRTLAGISMDILGLYGPVESGSPWTPMQGRVCMGYLDSISGPIGAGSSEIQRIVMATRGLGLPRGD
ncbi:acyl-CoA dehydrogenase family protein [Thermodesulfobacteriota bacterium]